MKRALHYKNEKVRYLGKCTCMYTLIRCKAIVCMVVGCCRLLLWCLDGLTVGYRALMGRVMALFEAP
jgi:hypothetical protein